MKKIFLFVLPILLAASFANALENPMLTSTQLISTRIEKISGPSQIKFYKNITKQGNSLFGKKKTGKEFTDVIYNIIKNSK